MPTDDGISPEVDFCYSEAKDKGEYFGWDNAKVYPDRRPERLTREKADANRANYEGYLHTYKGVVNNRFSTMIQRLFETLPLDDLIRAINALPEASGTPPCLQLPIALWNDVLKDNTDLTWCSVRHDQSIQQVIETKDFYHSLCYWLAIGKEIDGSFHCVCWHLSDAETLYIEAGQRRLRIKH